MRTSSIHQPANSRYIQLHAWQVEFCKGNHCAALLLSFFSNWHDWKLENDNYYKRSNDIAEMHGDGRPHNQNAYLFFTTEDFIDGCMGLYGKKAICAGLELLIELKVISKHKNPNPRYHFDKTKYFQFYPDVCNQWIDDQYKNKSKADEKIMQPIENKDSVKMPDREGKNDLPSVENGRPSSENTRAITNTTNNTTNKKQSNPQVVSEDLNFKKIIELLKALGLSYQIQAEEHVILKKLIEQGATPSVFTHAFELADKATKKAGKSFGIRYLEKVVTGLLERDHVDEPSIKQYENDFSGGLSWMGDLVDR